MELARLAARATWWGTTFRPSPLPDGVEARARPPSGGTPSTQVSQLLRLERIAPDLSRDEARDKPDVEEGGDPTMLIAVDVFSFETTLDLGAATIPCLAQNPAESREESALEDPDTWPSERREEP